MKRTATIHGIPDDRFREINRICEILEDYACADTETEFCIEMHFIAGRETQEKCIGWRKKWTRV